MLCNLLQIIINQNRYGFFLKRDQLGSRSSVCLCALRADYVQFI